MSYLSCSKPVDLLREHGTGLSRGPDTSCESVRSRPPLPRSLPLVFPAPHRLQRADFQARVGKTFNLRIVVSVRCGRSPEALYCEFKREEADLELPIKG